MKWDNINRPLWCGQFFILITFELPINLRIVLIKSDVIKINFWNYGICQDILKEQWPKGLLTKNEHCRANCLWDRSPVMLRKLHTNPSKFFGVDPPKIRRVCMEFSEYNRLTYQRQFATKCSFLASRPLGHYSFRISWQAIISEISFLWRHPFSTLFRNPRRLSCTARAAAKFA